MPSAVVLRYRGAMVARGSGSQGVSKRVDLDEDWKCG